ncbi:MAG: hypothetical protein QOH66_2213 [Actinomycetota bacterium]|jgi:hypothetical protein|nr:hypothetical protein [Actinomycetota bacterium]MEA2589286.1 hypothetical protein [Actinomycetota bacterium]
MVHNLRINNLPSGLALLDVGEEAVGVHREIRPASRRASLSKGVPVNPDPSVVAPAQLAGFVPEGEVRFPHLCLPRMPADERQDSSTMLLLLQEVWLCQVVPLGMRRRRRAFL